MVAKIKTGKSLSGALYYNEHKVGQGLAILLDAPGFQKDAPQLSFTEKLSRLADLAGRNQRVRTNTLHVSLNFDVSEKLNPTLLCDIARDYMEGIGFKDQPYLVYQHLDAGHPHIHILSTNIDFEGNRISLHNLGKLRSEPTRKEIEVRYQLVKAQDPRQLAVERIRPKAIVYGKTDSRKAVSDLVHEIARTYRFTSLIEFNAILSRFNVVADRGNTTSVMYGKNGLRYWITNADGDKMGVPLKASQLYGKPTLPFLEKQFQLNKSLRKPCREILCEKIDKAVRKSTGLAELEVNLSKAGVDLIKRMNPEGRLYGLTYLDHDQRAIFNGSDLGKLYSAGPVIDALQYRKPEGDMISKPDSRREQPIVSVVHQLPGSSLLAELLEPIYEDQIPGELLKNKRKKKKRIHF
ncbi:relaxase/mobilization nuclease domain-containing protein [Mucilaginibacter terrae]|uniref:MobA/VirD2-like nuclease domain-containing protein n=1 Tax=Mucilaginibacter terrae TaxID=1955052 RepID=A0ABU3GWW7_9SPHI|nr:relaxase/mobilization nuclease domain-containing protein [Mucilaginibacter terrae]MDT3404249.1 hypothetical protein [Mucilaginibacter terrae]